MNVADLFEDRSRRRPKVDRAEVRSLVAQRNFWQWLLERTKRQALAASGLPEPAAEALVAEWKEGKT